MTGRRVLRTEAEITAAGAEAVRGWRLSDRQADLLAAIFADSATLTRPRQTPERRAA